MNITPQRRGRIMVINAVTLTVSGVLWWRSGSWVLLVGAGSGLLALAMVAARPYLGRDRSWRGWMTPRVWRWRARVWLRCSADVLVGVARFHDEDGDVHYQAGVGPLVVTALVWREFSRRELAAHRAWVAAHPDALICDCRPCRRRETRR